MKISISYPPLESDKGTPLLAQNRQYQWFNSPTYIYPMIPAYAATLLKQNGFEVFWDDGIAEGLSYNNWKWRLLLEKPDVIVIETKTPVVKRHWQIIDEVKILAARDRMMNCGTCIGAVACIDKENRSKEEGGWDPKIVLMGDHVTAFPEESLKNSRVDFVIQGGDYDFILLNLCQSLNKDQFGNWKLEIGNLQGGVWYRTCHIPLLEGASKRGWECRGPYSLHSHSLDELPMIDRELTKWQLYAFKNGNFKYTPGSYMMSARDCWHGICTFCSWTTLFPGGNWRTRSAKNALDEVGHLISLGIKEIMEDSGTLPIGEWLKEFCQGMIERDYHMKVRLSCNMRINAIKDPQMWRLMKKAGFRFILFGLESANQKTLDRINKNLRVEEIEPGLKMCKQAGLEPHITAMMGYPWETKEDAKKTVELAKGLFKKGYVDTLQATVIIPYPGTPLYKYCLDNNLLNFTDYDRFDQREQVMKSELTTEDVKELTQGLYKSFMTPEFIFRKLVGIKSWNDVKFLWRAGWKVLGHLMDFRK